MVCTRATEDAVLDIPEGSAGRGRGRGQAPHAKPPPPQPCEPISIEELLATQNELMRVLVQNEAPTTPSRPIDPGARSYKSIHFVRAPTTASLR
jgi:hypothetical protein